MRKGEKKAVLRSVDELGLVPVLVILDMPRFDAICEEARLTPPKRYAGDVYSNTFYSDKYWVAICQEEGVSHFVVGLDIEERKEKENEH